MKTKRKTSRRDTGDPVEHYLRARGVRADLVAGGLRALVTRWAGIVDEVARGYELTLDDYLNDMDVRDMIAGSLAVADATERRAVDRTLADADRKLQEATISSPSLLGSGNEVKPEQWWYLRKPRRALF